MATCETAPFLSLNEDVKRLIFSHLSKSDYRTLCLVHSSGLQRLAESFLYSSVDLSWEEWRASDGRTQWVHPLFPLLRTLLRRPELTEHIRAITYKREKRYQSQSTPFLIHPAYPLPEAIAFVEKSGLPYMDSWIMGLREGFIDAYLAVLLTQLPSLQHLHLGPDVFIEGNILGQAVRSLLLHSAQGLSSPHRHPIPGAQPGSLLCLQDVRLDRRLSRYSNLPYMEVRNTDDLLPFFYLPAIKHVNLSIDLPDTPTLWPAAFPPPSPLPSLTSLTLQGLRESHLSQLLSITPNLHAFHWEWLFCEERDGGQELQQSYNRPLVDMDLIISALEQVKPTLAELNIHALTTNDWGSICDLPLSVINPGRVGALSTFPRLTKLTIPLAFITGFDLPLEDMNRSILADCLPPTLEYLTFSDHLFYSNELGTRVQWDEPSYIAVLIPWLENLRTYTPRLNRLQISIEGMDEEDFSDGDEVDFDDLGAVNSYEERTSRVRKKIQRLARRQGLELVMSGDAMYFPETGWGN